VSIFGTLLSITQPPFWIVTKLTGDNNPGVLWCQRVPSPWEWAMRPSFLSWKKIVSVGAALALLLIVGPTNPTPALAGSMGGGGHHGGGGGGGWSGGGGGGVGVGIGVGSILLNEAIRRSQERHQAAEPQGCPPGLVPSRKGCVKPG
jgi:hypothetical protein